MSAFVAHRAGGGLPQAVVVSGSGSQEADGVYKATEKTYCEAPVYEHMERGADLKITREPHKNPKTGATKHGWLLGLQKTPLYGAPTEALAVPTTGWKKFTGEAPVPTVVVHEQLVDVFFGRADDAKAAGDAALEKGDWEAARKSFNTGLEDMKHSGERFGDPFRNRAALLLARRAGANAKLEDHKAALRDAVATLELVRSLASAESIAVEACRALGCPSDAMAQRVLEPIGTGRILDSGAPLVLRCVDRWIVDLVQLFEDGDAEAPLPEPRHLAADRYLEDVDDDAREEVLKKHVPGYFTEPGGTGIVKDAGECMAMMRKWEEVFASQDFQQQRKDLWGRPLNYVRRLKAQKEHVASSLSEVLEPMGFAPGLPGLTRVVQQMQVYWSSDKAVAGKALDLEELADISLADLE